jgi:hypothetical protein
LNKRFAKRAQPTDAKLISDEEMKKLMRRVGEPEATRAKKRLYKAPAILRLALLALPSSGKDHSHR